MKLAVFRCPGSSVLRAGAVEGDTLRELDVPPFEPSHPAARAAERAAWSARLCARLLAGELVPRPTRAVYPLTTVELLPPVFPLSFRDFYAFEAHVRAARRRRGLDVPPEWYRAPAFYFSNTAGIAGPQAPVRPPRESRELDYELELAVVIGREARDVAVEEADACIAGYTILNDWSARDIQRREMAVGLGPAKGKDFATTLGPFLVTPDELEERVLPDRARGRRHDLAMLARVNGREYSRGNAREMHWTFAELIAHASRDTVLLPGDLIASGTVGGGCILELHDEEHPWLQPGDEVELEIERLGVLRNRVTSDPPEIAEQERRERCRAT